MGFAQPVHVNARLAVTHVAACDIKCGLPQEVQAKPGTPVGRLLTPAPPGGSVELTCGARVDAIPRAAVGSRAHMDRAAL